MEQKSINQSTLELKEACEELTKVQEELTKMKENNTKQIAEMEKEKHQSRLALKEAHEKLTKVQEELTKTKDNKKKQIAELEKEKRDLKTALEQKNTHQSSLARKEAHEEQVKDDDTLKQFAEMKSRLNATEKLLEEQRILTQRLAEESKSWKESKELLQLLHGLKWAYTAYVLPMLRYLAWGSYRVGVIAACRERCAGRVGDENLPCKIVCTVIAMHRMLSIGHSVNVREDGSTESEAERPTHVPSNPKQPKAFKPSVANLSG
eukprot:6473521-Amphidinium_carterae.1